ncbi:DUF1513 domain-containing protein [Reinekea sp.]|uniref:DUF1513 domain-containing protein n=1 Tax=Reinekea sp. TaxID=1970455 RepID=UPI003989A199
MAINRRKFLGNVSALTLANLFLPKSLANLPTANSEHIIGTSRLDEQHFTVSSIDLDGRLNWQLLLPSRGHDVCCHDNKPIAAVIARRPDRYIILFDPVTGVALQELTVDANLKLNGHACWVGDKLIVTASDRVSSKMCLLVYSLHDSLLELTTIKHFEYFGPHEIISANSEIWVAVGGLKTQGRDVTNKQTLESFLLRLTTQLDIIEEHPAPFASVSLRHLAIDDQNQVFIAGQFQLDPNDSPPLLYALRNKQLLPFETEPALWSQVNGYIGSIICVENNVVASSPRSHWLGWFDSNTLTQQKSFMSADVCALANTNQGLVAGAGTGRLYMQGRLISSKVRWDNHFMSYLINSEKPAKIN